MRKKISPLLLVALVQLAASPLYSASDLPKKLEEFRQKLAAKSPAEKRTGPDSALSALDLLIANLPSGQVRQIEDYRFSNLPTELHEEWRQLQAPLAEYIEQQRANNSAAALESAKAFAAKVHDACLSAKQASDLEPFLPEIANLESQPGNIRNGDRAQAIRAGANHTLKSWIQYLDFRRSGNNASANGALNTLKSSSYYPVLSVEEIQKFLLPVENESSASSNAGVQILSKVKTPNEIASALDQMEKLVTGPNADLYSRLEYNRPFLLSLSEAWKACEEGRLEDAVTLYESPPSYRDSDTYVFLERLKNQVASRILILNLNELAGIKTPFDPNANTKLAVDLALDTLYQQRDFVKLQQAMRLRTKFIGTGGLPQDYMAINRYLTAQSFEAAGDMAAAIENYRESMRVSDPTYPPRQENEAALARLRKSHPELFKDPNLLILNQLRDMQQMLINLQNTVRSTPGPNNGARQYTSPR